MSDLEVFTAILDLAGVDYDEAERRYSFTVYGDGWAADFCYRYGSMLGEPVWAFAGKRRREIATELFT